MKKREWDFEPETKEAKQILKSMKKYIIKGYGKRCPKLACKCPCCEAWIVYDLIKIWLF